MAAICAFFAMKSEVFMTTSVSIGRDSPGSISSNIFWNFGTMKIIKPAVIPPAIQRTEIG